MKVFLDIETVGPEQGTPLNKALVSKLIAKRGAPEVNFDIWTGENLRELALHAEYGRIIAVGLIIEEGPRTIYSGVIGRSRETRLFHADERRTLRSLWKLLRGFREGRDRLYVHHAEFDICYLQKRSVLCGIRPTVRLEVPRWRACHIVDTMRAWNLYGWGVNLKLSELAELFGIEGGKKDGLDGSCVAGLYSAMTVESHQALADYCFQDVVLLRAIAYRMDFEEITV